MVEDNQIKAQVSPFAIREGEIKTFDTNGKEVKIYCAESQTLYSAFWVEDTYIMELTYSGETDTDELLRLINTIK